MTAHSNWSRMVRFSRFLRLSADLFVLATGVFLLLWAFSLSNLTHWAQITQRHTKTHALNSAKQPSRQPTTLQDEQLASTWLNRQHSDETQAWKLFEQWLHAGQYTSGHCSLSGLHQISNKAIELNCVGGQSEPQSEQINLDVGPLNLIITRPPPSPIQLSVPSSGTPASTETAPTHVVQGWIDLPSGTQRYNGQHKRWQP